MSDGFKYSSTWILVYLSTASTVLGLELILAILLCAVFLLGLYLTVKVIGLDKNFPKYFFMFSLNSWFYLNNWIK